MGEACSELGDDEKWVQNVGWKGRDHSKDLGVDGRMILKCVLEKSTWRVWICFTWLRIVTVGRLL
jgi:hypothetical protein